MKPETEKLLTEFLDHADDLGDGVIEEIGELLGVVPFIFTVLREQRPEVFALSTLGDYYISRPESLDGKTAELVTMAAAAGAGADACLKVHMRAALKEGASSDEILDVLQIAAMIGKTRVLASSLRTYREVCGEEQTSTR